MAISSQFNNTTQNLNHLGSALRRELGKDHITKDVFRKSLNAILQANVFTSVQLAHEIDIRPRAIRRWMSGPYAPNPFLRERIFKLAVEKIETILSSPEALRTTIKVVPQGLSPQNTSPN